MTKLNFNWVFPDSFVFPALVASSGMALSIFYGYKLCTVREKLSIKAPHLSDEPEFKKAAHDYHSTHDSLPIVIPSVFMFSHLISPNWSLIIGSSWVLSRLCYCCNFCCKKENENEVVKNCHYMLNYVSQMALVGGSMFGLAVSLANRYKLLHSK
ncbi:putative MAPEG family protein [Tieghemostelium lacteum]|uniref:Putative MAPEG family protein n=1 Tax=Tieghemostelium lacteum TaxID=361077 RepID=A0A151Z852_TIELA|nr:putative MAPEG family protein [Tieghemostelium lacteum]|eukprot:KYQ90132.1 putative MAPEG family protein [Tieghemostelium lacteum]